jgi:P27 family predicted phage terminase small subunit
MRYITVFTPLYYPIEGDAVIAWGEMTGYIRKMGILSMSDTHLLALYCRAYRDYMECQRKTDEEGLVVSGSEGNLKRNPFDHAKRDYYNLMMRILARFGLSPSDRAGIDMSKAGDESQDPFVRLAKISDAG